MAEVIYLGQKQKTDDSNIIKLGSRISPKGIQVLKPTEAFKILASPKTTVALAGTLGGLLGGIGTGIKTAALTALGAGALQTSPYLQKKAVEKIKDPTAAGRFVGTEIEKIATGKREEQAKSLKESVIEGAKKAGIVGAAVAGTGAALYAGKKIIEKVKKSASSTSTSPKSLTPSTAPAVVGASVFEGGEPVAPASIQIPAEKPTTAIKEAKPMNITQKVRINIVNRPQATNKRLIKNIILPITR